MTIWPFFKLWCTSLAATLVGVAVCIRWLDIPVASVFHTNVDHFTGLGRGLSSFVLVSGEILLIISLAIARMIRGALSDFAKALFVASSASLSAFVANDYVLKVIFGRQNPSEFFQAPTTQVFHFFQGDQHSSFPSGHMVMATAFAVAMIRFQPRTSPILIVLLCIGAIGLLVGDWHFVGDVIAGAFLGATAGFIAGELWSEHVQGRTPNPIS
jgi:membrane-associated phospholipid phosphatase